MRVKWVYLPHGRVWSKLSKTEAKKISFPQWLIDCWLICVWHWLYRSEQSISSPINEFRSLSFDSISDDHKPSNHRPVLKYQGVVRFLLEHFVLPKGSVIWKGMRLSRQTCRVIVHHFMRRMEQKQMNWNGTGVCCTIGQNRVIAFDPSLRYLYFLTDWLTTYFFLHTDSSAKVLIS